MARKTQENPQLDMTPMIDVVFELIIFFVVTLVEAQKKDESIDMPDGSKWTYPVSQGVISLQTTRDTGYQAYIQVQNELARAFNEIRDDLAEEKFGSKFADLTEQQRTAITKAVPLKISEAEPRNIKK